MLTQKLATGGVGTAGTSGSIDIVPGSHAADAKLARVVRLAHGPRLWGGLVGAGGLTRADSRGGEEIAGLGEREAASEALGVVEIKGGAGRGGLGREDVCRDGGEEGEQCDEVGRGDHFEHVELLRLGEKGEGCG